MDTQIKYEIGQRIRDCRISKGMTQSEFAESVDISINFLSEIENGKKGLSCETLYQICNIHTLSANYILFGEQPKKPNYTTLIDLSNNLSNDELSMLIDYLNALLKLRTMA